MDGGVEEVIHYPERKKNNYLNMHHLPPHVFLCHSAICHLPSFTIYYSVCSKIELRWYMVEWKKIYEKFLVCACCSVTPKYKNNFDWRGQSTVMADGRWQMAEFHPMFFSAILPSAICHPYHLLFCLLNWKNRIAIAWKESWKIEFCLKEQSIF